MFLFIFKMLKSETKIKNDKTSNCDNKHYKKKLCINVLFRNQVEAGILFNINKL